MDDLQVDEWEEMIDVNLKGTLYGIAAALAVFKKQGSGHIINIISTSGIKIVPCSVFMQERRMLYEPLVKRLRQESNGRYRVTGISPGFVNTELANHIKDDTARSSY